MIPIYTITAIFALCAQMFFTTTEMAFTVFDKVKLKGLMERGDSRAVRLNEFLSKEGMFLGTTLVGINISVVVTSTLMTRVFAEYFRHDLAPVITTCIMVPITLVFAEITPKMIAREFPTNIALFNVRFLAAFFRLFKPIILSVNYIGRVILALVGSKSTPWDVTFTKRDLKTLVVSGHEAGEVEKDELELIHKVLDFGAKPVRLSMTPLYRVYSISEEDSIENLKKLVSLTGFSRIPVYRKNKNSIVGIVNIYDVLFGPELEFAAFLIPDYMREPVYVNQDDGIDIAFTRLKHKKQPMGIVVDNSDNPVGIITIEDILEEIVGNIEDRG